MNKDELLKMAEGYQDKADRNFQYYQETGTTRYHREYRKNEQLADAMRMAAAAADEHNKLIHLRSNLSTLAGEAKRIDNGDVLALNSLKKNLLVLARLEGLIT